MLHNTKELIWQARAHISGSVCDLGAAAEKYQKIFIQKIDKYSAIKDIEGFGEDENKLQFQTDSFDTILALELIEHWPDPQMLINEIRRILKPGGICILTAPFIYFQHKRGQLGDYRRFTPDGLRALAENNGFEVIKANAYNNFFGTIFILFQHQFLSGRSGSISRFAIDNLKDFAWWLDSHSADSDIFSNSYMIAKKL